MMELKMTERILFWELRKERF